MYDSAKELGYDRLTNTIMSFLGGKVGPSTSHRVWEIPYLSVLPGAIDKYVGEDSITIV